MTRYSRPGLCAALEVTRSLYTAAGAGQDREKHRDKGWGRGLANQTGASGSSSGCWMDPHPLPSPSIAPGISGAQGSHWG